MDPQMVLAIAGFLIVLLLGVVGWFARTSYSGMQADLKKEQDERAEDRHTLRNEINAVGARLTQFELAVAKECINHEHLAVAMQPVMARLGEIRSDIKELFQALAKKQDKLPGAD